MVEKTHKKLKLLLKLELSYKRLIIGILPILAFLSWVTPAFAQISIISDEETESYLAHLMLPIFKTANIPFNRNKIYIVNDNSLNAFVADGNNLFIHTGTLIKADNEEQIKGVLAHEVGHILGGHILRQKLKMQDIQEASLASLVLAGALGAASGRGDVAMAVMMGSQSSFLSHYLKYRIEEERSADDAAITLLQKNNTSPKGLLDFMKKLQKQNKLNGVEENLYFRTHPLTTERVSFLQQAVKKSPFTEKNIADDSYLRIKAKLIAFLYDPEQTFLQYPSNDNTIPAKYAHAIAFMKQLNFKRAHDTINQLIAIEPNNPYFHEVSAQIYLEEGNLEKAKIIYDTITKLSPKTPLFQLDRAQIVLAGNPSAEEIKDVIIQLNQALLKRDSLNGWLLLSQAYHANNQPAYAAYAAAEFSLRIGKPKTALRQIQNAKLKKTNFMLNLKLEDLEKRIKNLYPLSENENFAHLEDK